jgi:FixJ family two-component response regulator
MTRDQDGGAADQESVDRAGARAAIAQLGKVEQTILSGIANGESSKSIAAQMEMQNSAIEDLRATLMRKINAGSTADAVRIALLAGMGERLDRTNPH